jgi:hypothetical protein
MAILPYKISLPNSENNATIQGQFEDIIFQTDLALLPFKVYGTFQICDGPKR